MAKVQLKVKQEYLSLWVAKLDEEEPPQKTIVLKSNHLCCKGPFFIEHQFSVAVLELDFHPDHNKGPDYAPCTCP